jgi:hypothetical protein
LSKEDKLQRVYETAEAFRVAQQSVAPGGRIREEFIDSIMDAKDARLVNVKSLSVVSSSLIRPSM